jgi:superfamily II DNA or RNA helicase
MKPEEFTERYYQREARAAIKEGLTKHKSGILHLGTGAGKTSVVAKDISDTTERCLFLGDQEELLDQPLRAFEDVGGVLAAREQAKIHAPLEARVVVASSQTMIKKARMERFPRDHFDRIYIDEAHRGSDRDKKICDHFETAKKTGLTATPFRATMKDLTKYYETVFYSKPMMNLVEEGFAPPMQMFHLPHEVDLASCTSKKKFGVEDYLAEDIDSTITPELEAIAAIFAEHAKHRHTIAYLPLIKTSEAFAAALRNVGVNARHIEGGSPNRIQLQKAFREGEIDCLTNAGVMSTGVDLPIADCFLNLRPLKSMTEYQQSAGRSMRVLPGLIDHLPEKDQAALRHEFIEWSQKPNTLMFDLLWQNDTLGVMTPAHLVATSDAEAREMNEIAKRNLSPEDLLALQRRVQK